MLKLTQLESGTPCWINSFDVSMINTGVKTLPVDQIVVGQPYEIAFSKVSLKNGAHVTVREEAQDIVRLIETEEMGPMPERDPMFS